MCYFRGSRKKLQAKSAGRRDESSNGIAYFSRIHAIRHSIRVSPNTPASWAYVSAASGCITIRLKPHSFMRKKCSCVGIRPDHPAIGKDLFADLSLSADVIVEWQEAAF